MTTGTPRKYPSPLKPQQQPPINRAEGREFESPLLGSPSSLSPSLLSQSQSPPLLSSPSQESSVFQSVIEAIPQLVWVAAADGSCPYFNARWLAYTGLTFEESLLQGWESLLHPDDRARAVQVWEESLASGAPFEMEYRLRNANGAFRWMDVRAVPMRGENGEIVRWVGTCHDIHDLKQAQEERDRFFTLSLDMLGVVDTKTGHLQRVNPAFVETLGFSEAELMELPFRQRVHPDDRAITQAAVDNLKRGLPLPDLVNRYPAKDGSWRWLEWRSVPVPAEGLVYATARDITGRKEAEAQLQYQKALLEAQSETSLDGILIVSESGRILSHNRQLVEMWGLSEEVLEQHDDALLLREISMRQVHPDAFCDKVAFLNANREEHSREELSLCDGRILDWYSAPIVGADGTYYGRVWYFRDVTDHKLAQAELQQVNLKLGALAVTDSLTGLSNRRALDIGLQRELQRAVKHQRPLSLVLLDVDHFKSYNDVFGHPAGDAVLETLGYLLREHAREADLVARYGGEEFALVLVDADANESLAIAERLRHSIESAPWEKRAVTASFGVATLSPEICGIAGLLTTADAALYHSKNNGRNRVTHCAQTLGADSRF